MNDEDQVDQDDAAPEALDPAILNPTPLNPIVYDVIINGKQVHFRRNIPEKEGKKLFRLMEQIKPGALDTDKQKPIMAMVIESWELPGDPHNQDAYGELDLFEEFLPLVKVMGEYLQARMERLNSLKN